MLPAMANVSFRFSNNVFQAPGTAAWNLPWGDRDSYWGFAVRPFQANNTAVLERVSANTDNDLNTSTDITVTVISAPGIFGGLFRFTAIRVTP
jgi:hypothetical protein